MNNRTISILVALGLALLLANSAIFIVKETERAVLLRFGELVKDDIQPGLHFKIPWVHKVRKFDARVLTMDAQPESFFTLQKKRLIVDAFVKWRIVDVGEYYRATGGDQLLANNRLANRANDGLRNQFGTRTLNEVVSGERDQLMQHLADDLNSTVRDELGVEVIDVRVKRIDLPTEVSEQVYRRMRTEREKEARQLRSTGLEEAEKIRADADRQRTIIQANAYREAELLRGQGDAEATSIYAAAFGKDREFYTFVRSLNAYKASFANKGDILLIDPKADFFRYFNDQQGK